MILSQSPGSYIHEVLACKIHPTRAVSLELPTLCSYHPHQSCYQQSHYCAQFLLTLCTINTLLIFINGLMTDPVYSYQYQSKAKKNSKHSEPGIQTDLKYTENIKFHREGT